MRKPVSIIVCFVLFQVSFGMVKDSSLKRNSIFVEAGGRGGFFSLGYEHIFASTKKINFSVTTGFSMLYGGSKFGLPVSLALDYGRKNNRLTFFACATNLFNAFPTARVVSERRKDIKEGHGCPPESTPIYARVFSSGLGYKKIFSQGKLSLEITLSGVIIFYDDLEYLTQQCHHLVKYQPWGGLKLNYYLS
jgi:hypothetical protein